MRLREVGLQLGFRTDPKEFRQTSVKKILQFKVTDVASMFPVAFLSIERKAEALYIKDFRLFLGGWRVGLEPTTFRTTI